MFGPLLNRSRQGSFESPAMSKSVFHRREMQSEVAGQHRTCPSDAVDGVQHDARLILALCRGGGPSTILRRIALIVGDAVDGVFRGRSRSHVGVKGGERGQPTLTDCYTASAVFREGRVRRARASFDHADPNTELRRVREAVGRFGLQHLHFNAPARVGARQVPALHGHDGSAVASTTVDGVFRSLRIALKREHDETAIPMTWWKLGQNHAAHSTVVYA